MGEVSGGIAIADLGGTSGGSGLEGLDEVSRGFTREGWELCTIEEESWGLGDGGQGLGAGGFGSDILGSGGLGVKLEGLGESVVGDFFIVD